jgi:hypothetical protein
MEYLSKTILCLLATGSPELRSLTLLKYLWLSKLRLKSLNHTVPSAHTRLLRADHIPLAPHQEPFA